MAHQAHCIHLDVSANKGVLYSCSLAKSAAAFFKISLLGDSSEFSFEAGYFCLLGLEG